MVRSFRTLIAMLLASLSLGFVTSAAPAQPPVIQEIAWHEFGLVVKASAPLTPEIFTLEAPWRFVVDLPSAELADSTLAQTRKIGKEGVKQLRLAQKTDSVRMVLDCEGPLGLQVMRVGDGSTLVISQTGRRNDKLAELLEIRSDYAGGPQPIQALTAHVSPNQMQLRLTANKPLTYALVEPDATRLQIRVPKGQFAGALPKGSQFFQRAVAKTSFDGTWLLDVALKDGMYNLSEQRDPNGVTLTWEKVPPRRFPGRPLVVIDPGHGGKDPGAIGPTGATEASVNLAIARQFEAELAKHRINSVLTRRTDAEVLLAPRLATIDRHRADLFVSIHANSHTTPESNGIETYWREAPSRNFAHAVHKQITAALKRPDRGVKQERLYVLRHPNVPSLLLESGFISNPVEEGLLSDPRYQAQAAAAIATGVLRYMAAPNMAVAPEAVGPIKLEAGTWTD